MSLRESRVPRPHLPTNADKYLPVWVVFAMTVSVFLLSCQMTAGIKDSAQRDAVTAAGVANAAAIAAASAASAAASSASAAARAAARPATAASGP